jgi:hypothetical protein
MRKVSTAKQGRNCSEQKLTIGLDLGDHSSCDLIKSTASTGPVHTGRATGCTCALLRTP